MPSILARESGIGRSVVSRTHSLPLAQGLPKDPPIVVYCGEFSRVQEFKSGVRVHVCCVVCVFVWVGGWLCMCMVCGDGGGWVVVGVTRIYALISCGAFMYS